MYFSLNHFLRPSALIILLCIATSSRSIAAEDGRHDRTVKDLAYGTALYQLFQHKKLKAITDLSVAKARHTLKNQPDDADLLLGGLYIDYGLPDEAERILTRLLDEKTGAQINGRQTSDNLTSDNQTKNGIWFNLARLQYEKNNVQQALQLLNRITDELPPQREAQKRYLLTNIHIQNEHFEQAAETASASKLDSLWSAYSQYNLGVSLNFSGQNEQAQNWLSKLIERKTQDAELRSLQDAARLVSGLSALRQNQLLEAIKYLGGIHTSSPLINKALLATGWAWSQLAKPKKALSYWLTLTDKKQEDAASLEAYLAIATAYEQLNNKARAIKYYKQALLQIEKTINNMDEAIDSIYRMELINALYRDGIIQPGLQNSLEGNLPQHLATPYLHRMFGGKAFQQTLLNYQELIELHNSLILWKSNLPALDLMLSERVKSFENKRDLVKQTTDFEKLDLLQKQRDELASEVQRIKQSEDIFALANEDETDTLEQLSELRQLLLKLQDKQDLTDESEKYNLLAGLLQWDLSIDFPKRYWTVFHQLQLLDRSLDEAKQSALSLQQASAIYELKLKDFKQRISGQNNEIERLEINASQLIEQQEQLINMLAADVIDNRKQHLIQLRLNARYSLTRLYDDLSKRRSAR